MDITNAAESAAFYAGRRAWGIGDDQVDNPHDDPSPEFLAWATGWKQANDDHLAEGGDADEDDDGAEVEAEEDESPEDRENEQEDDGEADDTAFSLSAGSILPSTAQAHSEGILAYSDDVAREDNPYSKREDARLHARSWFAGFDQAAQDDPFAPENFDDSDDDDEDD